MQITPGAYPEIGSIIATLAQAIIPSKDRSGCWRGRFILALRPQVFFYSATMNLAENSPIPNQIRKYMSQLSSRGNPEIVATSDVKEKEGKETSQLPQGLALRAVQLAGDREKEEFLFYFGKQYSGHILVFFNSIRHARRVK